MGAIIKPKMDRRSRRSAEKIHAVSELIAGSVPTRILLGIARHTPAPNLFSLAASRHFSFAVPSGAPTSSTDGGSLGDKLGPGRKHQIPTGDQPTPIPTEPGGQTIPGGDVFGRILTELDKAIRDGRLKPVVIGPIEIPIPGQAGPATPGQPQ